MGIFGYYTKFTAQLVGVDPGRIYWRLDRWRNKHNEFALRPRKMANQLTYWSYNQFLVKLSELSPDRDCLIEANLRTEALQGIDDSVRCLKKDGEPSLLGHRGHPSTAVF